MTAGKPVADGPDPSKSPNPGRKGAVPGQNSLLSPENTAVEALRTFFSPTSTPPKNQPRAGPRNAPAQAPSLDEKPLQP